MDQLFYTIHQCCQMAAVGRTKFYQLIASGEIPVRKIGRRTLIAAADLQSWARRLPVLASKRPTQSPCEQARARAVTPEPSQYDRRPKI
jgi:excisionase family DNA binding protein